MKSFCFVKANIQEPVQTTILASQKSISQQIETIGKLGEVASKYPYYKYNYLWTRDIQNAVRELYHCDIEWC